MIKQTELLPPPSKHPFHLPLNAKWLSGEGAGSYYALEQTDKQSVFKVARYSPEGNIECEGEFTANHPINLNEEFSMTYPSHCAKVTIIQFGKPIILIRLN